MLNWVIYTSHRQMTFSPHVLTELNIFLECDLEVMFITRKQTIHPPYFNQVPWAFCKLWQNTHTKPGRQFMETITLIEKPCKCNSLQVNGSLATITYTKRDTSPHKNKRKHMQWFKQKNWGFPTKPTNTRKTPPTTTIVVVLKTMVNQAARFPL